VRQSFGLTVSYPWVALLATGVQPDRGRV